MSQPARVPASIEELVRTHQKFIVFLIYRVSRGKVRSDDIPDLLQQIYLRIWEKNYLTRCRELIAERGGGCCFNTYLWWLVRSVCCNQFRQNRKNPVSTAFRVLDPRDRPQHRRPVKTIDGVDLEKRGYVDTEFEARLERQDQLVKFAEFVRRTRRGKALSATLQSLYEGLEAREIAALHRVSKSRVAQRTRELRDLRGVYLQHVSA